MNTATVTGTRPATVMRPLGALRLTARGRRFARLASWLAVTVVVAAVALLLWLLAASLVAPGASAGDGSSAKAVAVANVDTVEVVVRPGDSLWGIAQKYAPTDDPRSVVAAVVEFNELPDAAVQAGAVIKVPRG